MDNKKAPEREQALCITCGLCCDGTLFPHAELDPSEVGNLPALIEQNVFILSGKYYFRLPCLYLAGSCTIYEGSRAGVCGSYRCRLLKDMTAGRISFTEASQIVQRARQMRDQLNEAYRSASGNGERLPFTRILRELGKYHERIQGTDSPERSYEILQAGCNIFEALLIRHFRPEGDFDDMVMKQDGINNTEL